MDDTRIENIPASACAEQAARVFAKNDSQLILDLGCSAGRDSLYLANGEAMVIGLDAARSGLMLGIKRGMVIQSRSLWVESDARLLPFADGLFDGVYCFWLLHEFAGETAKNDVRKTMAEIKRVLKPTGVAIVATAAGDPQKGLPHVQNFTESMFDAATAAFHCIEKRVFDDLGCTGRTDYRVWFGHFTK